MPTYSYACTACEHRFDAQQSFTDDALTSCPRCGGRLRKLFGNVGVVFKGSGFYRTDARAGEKTAASRAGSDGSGGSDAGSSGGSGAPASTSSGASSSSAGGGSGSGSSGGSSGVSSSSSSGATPSTAS
ncbi:MAG TPA: zinc ribbon domain-containing protein [Actinotalea sp.]|nr:zinc ribbon domain-containing protein [Actinotalea sp.]